MVTREMSNLVQNMADSVWLKDTHNIYLTCNTLCFFQEKGL